MSFMTELDNSCTANYGQALEQKGTKDVSKHERKYSKDDDDDDDDNSEIQ
jgi:hypothetical protein